MNLDTSVLRILPLNLYMFKHILNVFLCLNFNLPGTLSEHKWAEIILLVRIDFLDMNFVLSVNENTCVLSD